MKTIFYQSSMPRSGSTLLQNIIGQNPKFFVTPTSGAVDLILGSRIGYNKNQEAKSGNQKDWKNGFTNYCRYGLEGYFTHFTDKPYILDKSRAWKAHFGLLKMIYSNPKMIVMVRDLRDIIASMENKFRLNPDKGIEMVNNEAQTGITPFQRAGIWLQSHPISLSLLRLQNLLMDYENVKDVLFIRYEDLCQNPNKTLEDIYNYLQVEQFKHNFSNINQITHEDDTVHGIYGDHIIRPILEKSKLNAIDLLGRSTCDLIKNDFKWYFTAFNYI